MSVLVGQRAYRARYLAGALDLESHNEWSPRSGAAPGARRVAKPTLGGAFALDSVGRSPTNRGVVNMSGRLFLCVTFVAVASSMLALPRASAQTGGQQGAAQQGGGVQGVSGAEPCKGSPHCAWSRERNLISHEVRTPDLRFTFAYPFALPEGGGGVSAVAINSKGHLFALQRNAAGKPQLFEFDERRKLVRAIGDDVIGHQNKTHGMAIDAEDNIWICDENGDTVMKLSPQGRLLMTIGVRGQRGDWDEAKGQRLLWQPLHLAFGPNGDIYIGEGHANESPNDVDKSPTNSVGAARVLHLDKNGKFINQWFGNHAGQGHFSMVHGIAVNPDNGNVYLADREEYRLVVYDAQGKFVRTIQMRNLTCALYVDPHKQLWLATGQDGQIFKIDWDGNVHGAIGNGPGTGEGQFTESTYMAMDAQGNLYAGDTGAARITMMVAARK
jgi:sugar lactone lactonase YvrE